jgi:hypothetical protein
LSASGHPIEEPLRVKQIIAFRRDISPCAFRHRKLSDLIGVVATVGKQKSGRAKICERLQN